jgi:hypothetical protein
MKTHPAGRISEYLHNVPASQSASAYLKETGTMIMRVRTMMKSDRRTGK